MDENTTQQAPRRFWRVTFWTSDGREYRRYVKCPYLAPTEDHGDKKYRRPLVPGDADYPDTYLAMTARLGALEWDGVLTSYRATPATTEALAATCRKHPKGCLRERAVRWTEVYATVIAAA